MSVISQEPKRPGFRGRPGNPKNCQKCLARTRRGTACQCPAGRSGDWPSKALSPVRWVEHRTVSKKVVPGSLRCAQSTTLHEAGEGGQKAVAPAPGGHE